MMLTRENIKQAIDAISRRMPEIAYTLNTMLGKGKIDVPPASEPRDEKKPYFIFGHKKVFVNKFELFASGTPPLEQALLIHYGEMAQKHNLIHHEPTVSHGKHGSKADTAGFLLMLNYEIDLATAQLEKQITAILQQKNQASDSLLLTLLKKRLKKLGDIRNSSISQSDFTESWENPLIFSQGIVGDDTRASFMRFPFSRESLMQAARLNLEFFHIRFLLKCLVSGMNDLLFACIAKGKLQGLVFLEIKRKLFYKGFEIKYIATRGGSAFQSNSHPVKGIGTFIMAGIWMLWKSHYPDVKEIFLESEIEAEGFYATLGFQTRGPYRYILQSPEGKLLTTIAAMAAFSKKKYPSIINHLCKKVSGQIRILKKRKDTKGQRKRALAFIKIALHPASSDLLARTLMRLLVKNRSHIPEGEVLMSLAKAFGRMGTDPGQKNVFLPVAIIIDPRYQQHLMGVTHLENYKRIKAVENSLKNRELDGKWCKITPRFAKKSELKWVHTLAYVEKVEKTAGKKLSSFNFDTQTTEKSWSIARLAVGGVFSMIDKIMSGRSSRGFACIRPPGHHAGPSQGMGFCIFNNIALGAKYLKHRYRVPRLMIIDIDAHHGNGTQDIFYDTDEVLFVSIHESNSFPGTGKIEETGEKKGQGFTINIPLEKGSRARDIGRALYFIAGPVAQEYKPEMILVSFGFDLYIHDRLAGMNVTPNGYARITALLLEIAGHSAAGKIAFVMEGGYSIKGIQECGLTVMKEICNVPGVSEEKVDRIRKSDPSRLSILTKVIKTHKKYWQVLQ